ncbi:MAG: OmpH family outer membrane protein [Pseudomonadota bacterium]
MWARAFALIACCGFATPVLAQDNGDVTPQLLTLNQERLYANSVFASRVLRELEEASTQLAAENRRIEAALVSEEGQLVEDRATMAPAEFRALAEDFDARVTDIRQAQVDKRNALQARADAERARFYELAFPVLFALVEETGALAILNQNAVILSSRSIDVTDLAIERVNAQIGAAPLPPDAPTAPQPRPLRGQTGEPPSEAVPDTE